MKKRIYNRFLSRVLAASLAVWPVCRMTAQTTFTTLHSFTELSRPLYTNSDGVNPVAGLLLAGNSLYGTAYKGGDWNEGTVFSINTDGTSFTTLHSFTNIADAGSPGGNLVSLGSTVYGTAEFGGTNYKGGVFAVNTDGTGFIYLHAFSNGAFDHSGFFTNGDGAGPQAGMLLSSNTLYGTTVTGGLHGAGTVFAVNTDGTGFSILHIFTSLSPTGAATNLDGGFPFASLVLSGQTLYGTTELGGSAGAGTVFAVNTDGTGFTDLYTFTNGTDGSYPYAGLVLSGNKLYGAASDGGTSGTGTIFSLNVDGSGFTTLHSFAAIPSYPGPYVNADGANPTAGLILSGDTLYGTASSGGSSGSGSVFAVNTDGTGFTNLYSFTELPPFPGGSAPPSTNSDGANPCAGLVLAGGTLYGTVAHGGSSGYGTLFSLSLPSPGQFKSVGPAQLTIAMSGTNIVLTWPTNAAAITLQACTNLESPVWSRMPAGTIVDGSFYYSEPLRAGGFATRYYRLGQ